LKSQYDEFPGGPDGHSPADAGASLKLAELSEWRGELLTFLDRKVEASLKVC
jgi:hypothetical protein